MEDLVPIKVKIGLNSAGQADYPNFNSMQTVQNAGMDWSKYIDVHGTGWHYDCCGHQEEEVESPRGEQWGMILIDKAFADEAITRYPDKVEKLTETKAKKFYEENVSREMPDEEIDEAVVTSIKLKQDLGLPLTQQQQDAIDPTKPERGIKVNENKTFAGLKAKKGIKIVQ